MKVRLKKLDSDGCAYRPGLFSIVLRMSIIGSSVFGRRSQTDAVLRHSLIVIVSGLASQMSSTNASKSLRNCSAKSRRILICSSDLPYSSSSAIYCSPGSESSSSSRSNSSSWSSGGGGGGNGSSVRTSVSAERRFFLLPSTSRLISSKMSEANRFGGATRNKTPSLSSQ